MTNPNLECDGYTSEPSIVTRQPTYRNQIPAQNQQSYYQARQCIPMKQYFKPAYF